MANTPKTQLAAARKWQEKNRKQRVISFYPGNERELAFLDAQPKKSEYVRNLIREDMERRADQES